MKLIFHHPMPIDRMEWSASAIRPRKMLEAFEQLGFDVFPVTGFAPARARAVSKIRQLADRGAKFDLLYSESSTMPTLLTEPRHYPTHPRLDFNFLAWCQRSGITTGLFYRDIHWMFPRYDRDVRPPARWLAKAFYRYDLHCYRRFLDVLFLPSLEMGRYLPGLRDVRMVALPPGHSAPMKSPCVTGPVLRLFYVGGLSDLYRLHELFEAVNRTEGVELTICTRREEWLSSGHEYNAGPRIKVVHEYGEALRERYKEADLAVLFVQPHEYWEFASPLKFYEYIGFGKPVIASKGTLAGRLVQDEGVGWSVDYDASLLAGLLNRLLRNRELVAEAERRVAKVAEAHTWEARARLAVDVLASA